MWKVCFPQKCIFAENSTFSMTSAFSDYGHVSRNSVFLKVLAISPKNNVFFRTCISPKKNSDFLSKKTFSTKKPPIFSKKNRNRYF